MKKSQFKSNNKIIGFTLITIIFFAFTLIRAGDGSLNSSTIVDLNDEIYPSASASEVVQLNEGDTFDLNAEVVTKNLFGKELTLLGYNGSVPGPSIHVPQGSTVTIHFTNNTPFENTLHSHGVRMDNAFDGVPDVTQAPVQPGESFDYILTFPDAGTYWYHPHMREDLTQELGLYGAFIVEPNEEIYWNSVNKEELVFLDDMLIGKQGFESFYEDEITHTLMGRYGNEFLINGEESYELEVSQNETVRFSLINVANTRPFNIALNGVPMKLVGSDGGVYEQESFVDGIIIGPSERYLFESYFDEPGDYKIQNVTPAKTITLGVIHVSETATGEDFTLDAFNQLRTNTRVQDSVPNLAEYYDKAPDKKLRLNIEMGMMGGDSGMGHGMSGMPCHQMGDGSWMGDCDEPESQFSGIEWEDDMGMMNAMFASDMLAWQIIDEETGDINDEIEWDFDLGDMVLIQIENDKDSMHPMQHPIHFHGQRFLVLDENGVPNENLVWKDTVMIPTGDTYTLLLEVSNPGQWMAHCHIAEHLHNGMMFEFGVK